jgi:hypothetical protein
MERRHAALGEEFDSLDHARSTGRAHVVAIGDCHVATIAEGVQPPNAPPLMPHVWLDPCSLRTAGARGLKNPLSGSGSVQIFQRRIALAKTWQPLIFEVGEADTGFFIFDRAAKRGQSHEELMHQSIDIYLDFLREVQAQGFEQLFVLSAPATGGDRHIERGGTFPQKERTELTQRFNEELERRADFYTYVDITTPTLDPATGVLASQFVDPDDPDHLAPEPWGPVVAERLGPLLSPP